MPDLDTTLEAIAAALEGEDLEGALRLARRAARDWPDEPDAHLQYGDVLAETGEIEAARDAYEQAARLAPESAFPWLALAWAEFMMLGFDAARRNVTRANTLEATADGWSLMGQLEERDGRFEEAERCFRRARALDAEAYPLPSRLPESEFREVVSEALDRLPEEFRAALDGEVAVLVEPLPSLDVLRGEEPPFDPEILGLYVGTPLPERETTGVPRLPDVVYLFQRNLERAVHDRDELVEQIAITVYHEVGHYLGYDDDELDELGFG